MEAAGTSSQMSTPAGLPVNASKVRGETKRAPPEVRATRTVMSCFTIALARAAALKAAMLPLTPRTTLVDAKRTDSLTAQGKRAYNTADSREGLTKSPGAEVPGFVVWRPGQWRM